MARVPAARPSNGRPSSSTLLGPADASSFAEASGSLAGVDEAGRGPVLGPLVVAGVRVDDGDACLRDLGVKDSKKLTPAKREALFDAVHDAASAVVVRVIEPAELDARMADASLNAIEVDVFADVLAELAPARAVLDAADVNAHRFGALVGARLPHACRVLAEHKADDTHACVAAASIIAKVTRDRAVAAYADAYGRPVGSGYASDPATKAFLAEYVAEHGDAPSCARRAWATTRRLVPQNKSLTDFS